MTLKFWSAVAVALAVVWIDARAASAQEGTWTPDEFAHDLVARVEGSLDIGREIESGREDVVQTLRNDDRAARSWQLDPVLVGEMSDSDLFDYLVRRAQLTLVCGAHILSDFHLENQAGMVAAAQTMEVETDGFRMSWDCATILDGAGRPAMLRHRGHFDEAWSRVRVRVPAEMAFNDRKFQVDNEKFRANMRYLDDQYGGALVEVPGFAEQAGLSPGTRVYEKRVVNLTAYIGADGESGRLVFVAPLSH